MAQNLIETEYRIMKVISEDKTNHLTIKDLQQKTGDSMKHTITTLSVLEEKGFISKRNNDDKRFRLLSLTSRGKEVLEGLKNYFK